MFKVGNYFARNQEFQWLALFEYQGSSKSLFLTCQELYILLHDWEGNTGEYSVLGLCIDKTLH